MNNLSYYLDTCPDFIKDKFKIRQCKNFKYKDRPCLNYQIKKCFAPCMGYISKEEYRKNIDEVTLAPLMVVAGDHAKNDMASDEEGSWKSMLEKEGIKVNIYLKGLGENERFNQLYINRIEDLINERYIGIGETKKVFEERKKQ